MQGRVGALALCGCSGKQSDESRRNEALKNGDGNYYIRFMPNDREKHMPEFPEETDDKDYLLHSLIHLLIASIKT